MVADLNGLEVGSKNARMVLMEEVSWLDSGVLETQLSDTVQLLVMTGSEE